MSFPDIGTSCTVSQYYQEKVFGWYGTKSEARDIRNEDTYNPGTSIKTDETVIVPDTDLATNTGTWLLLCSCFIFCLASISFTSGHLIRDRRKLSILGNSLPDQKTLEHMVKRLGRKSNKIQLVCENICHKIAEQSPSIVHVFAAYKKDYSYNLHFVVLFENEINSEINLGYNCIHRSCNKDFQTTHLYSAESDSVLSPEESVLLRKTINENAVEYMDMHKYLSAISARKFICEGTKETCIVMYVDPCTEHYTSIPLKEEPIPRKIDIYNVIIRHGVFNACIGYAFAKHSNLPMGCQITSNYANGFGTLGGFIDHPDYGVCGFTCAHVVYNKSQIDTLIQAKRMKNFPSDEPCVVHQPDRGYYPIGRVVEATYTNGNTTKAGVDLALFQIENCHPVSGRFPSCPSNDVLNFDTGRTWGRTRINSTRAACGVLKFGSSTFCTRGQIVFDGMVVRDPEYKAKFNHESVPFPHFNQYEIENKTEDFCRQGDSGGLVFAQDHEGSLVCVGMIIGTLDGMKPLHGIVTPVMDILRELNVQSLKPFQNDLRDLEKRLSDRIEKVCTDQQQSHHDLIKTLDTKLSNFEKNIFRLLENKS